MKHVVMFSGGLGSWMTAKRVAEQHGTDNLYLVFADVKGHATSPHSGEDEDTYRFIKEAAANVGGELVWLVEGRDIWQVFKDNRFLGNSRLANCSKFLKQQPCREWLDANCDPADTTVYVGIDWTESHRLPAIVNAYLPYKAEAPLTEAPYLDKDDVRAACEAEGITIPRLYKAGFPHNNCFTPDTRFITDQGIKTLRETAGQSVRVLGKGGGWRDAQIKSFGEQETFNLCLTRYGDEKVISVTAGHLWPRRDRARGTSYAWTATTDLVEGDRLAGMYGQVRHNVRPSPVGVQAGFTFGDGTAGRPASGQITPAMAFFCGDKDKALLPYFSNCRTSVRIDGVVVAHDLPRSWKERPDLNESQSYLYGWLAGYFAADGTVAKGSARLASAKRENLLVVRDVCSRLGIATNPIRTESRLGYGEEVSNLYTVTLIAATLREDFFLIEEHRARFTRIERSRPADWKVSSVTPTGLVEEVMCAVVPEGNMFTLEDNVLTHNCGGFCVRAGQAQFELLLREHPERYAYHEAKEEELREYLGKDVSILKDRATGGNAALMADVKRGQAGPTAVPLTLRRFRERIEEQPALFDNLDFGGCGCFVEQEEPV